MLAVITVTQNLMLKRILLPLVLTSLYCSTILSQSATKLPPISDADYIYKKVEQMPIWPGCDQPEYTERDKSKCTDAYLREFIAEHMIYPKLAYDNQREGMCVVTFNIRKNGQLGEIRCARDIGLGCGEAATDIFHKINSEGIVFTPGYEDGEPQIVSYTFPVSFRLKTYNANNPR